MKEVKILGTGCANCKNTMALVEQVARDKGVAIKLEKVEDLLAFSLPKFVDEGKTDLVVAIGCTGGRHRSVCIAKELADFVARRGYATVTTRPRRNGLAT